MTFPPVKGTARYSARAKEVRFEGGIVKAKTARFDQWKSSRLHEKTVYEAMRLGKGSVSGASRDSKHAS